MKKLVKPLLLAGLVAAGFSYGTANANAPLDQLGIAQINPALIPAFQNPGSVVNFYGENYVITKRTDCYGPNFNNFCRVNMAHLCDDPGLIVKMNQLMIDGRLVTLVSARPDGKLYTVTYHQVNGPRTALDVMNVKRMDLF